MRLGVSSYPWVGLDSLQCDKQHRAVSGATWGWFPVIQEQAQRLLAKAREWGTGCSSWMLWLGQYCRNPFVARLAGLRLPIAIWEPEFLFLAGKESDGGYSSVCKIKKHYKIYSLFYSQPAFHFVNSLQWWWSFLRFFLYYSIWSSENCSWQCSKQIQHLYKIYKYTLSQLKTWLLSMVGSPEFFLKVLNFALTALQSVTGWEESFWAGTAALCLRLLHFSCCISFTLSAFFSLFLVPG